jgi:hypothetical protein
VWRNAQIRRSGVAMGGLRRSDRPFPVACVLAVVLLPAAISRQFGPSECAGPRPFPANLVASGERLNANTIVSAIPTYLIISRDWHVAKTVDANNL